MASCDDHSTSMQSWAIETYGGTPSIGPAVAPAPRADGDTTVEVVAACMTHLDRSVASGTFAVRPQLPHIGGTEGAGIVRDSAVLAPGTMVKIDGGGVGMQRPGTWTKLADYPNHALSEIPDGVDPAVAAAFGSAVSTAHVALDVIGKMTSDDHVLVTGAAGAVGALACQLAVQRGARRVTAMMSRPRDLAGFDGVEVLVETSETSPSGIDTEDPPTLVVDTVGGPTLPHVLATMLRGGRTVLVGYTHGEAPQIDLPDLMFHNVSLLPVNMMIHRKATTDVLGELLEQMQAGDLAMSLTKRPFAEGAAAWADLESGAIDGRLVLVREPTG